MPNTLGHLGVQGLATRLSIRGADPRWIALGCLLPDIPWILCRVAARFLPGLDPYDVQLYATVQASLAFCLVLSGGLALISAAPRRVFAILALNSLLHLLLDALEVKWGNGVHLLAPFSWKMLSIGWFWSDSLPGLLIALPGVGFGAWCLLRPPAPRAARPPGGPARKAAAAALLIGYLVGPVFLRGFPERVDNRYLGTLRHRADRSGRYVEFDRARISPSDSGDTLRFFSGESLRLAGVSRGRRGLASVRARFEDEGTLRVEELHDHPAGIRDGATYAGIALIALIWLRELGLAVPRSRVQGRLS